MMRPFLILPLVVSLTAGCTLGPRYDGPPVVAPNAVKAGKFVRAGDMPATAAVSAASWWESLNDPVLNGLMAKAIAGNMDVRAAEARLRQTRAALGLQRANGSPSLNGSLLYAHAHVPGVNLNGNGGSSDLDLYNIGFDANWELDLFGGQRSAVKAARATFERAEASLADVQVSLSAEVAQAYVNLRDRQQRVKIAMRSTEMQQEMFELTRQRFARGTAAELDVARMESDLGIARAQLAPLTAERDGYLNALATLTGEEPGALDAMLANEAPIPLPPAEVAIGDPAALLRQRPDIRAAERQLAADTAKVGQAEAARFPHLTFMGLIGVGGTKIGDLGNLDDMLALGAPQLRWNFLDFGRNRARVDQANAVRDEAEARYRAVVLGALRDAEDSLARFRDRRVTVATLARSYVASERIAALMSERFQAGTVSRIAMLEAEIQKNAARQNLLSAQSALTRDFVSIQKAFGLGWKSLN